METQLVSRSCQEVLEMQVNWLWRNWIPLAKLSILDGDPGLGKSTMLLDLTARVTTLGIMPNGSHGTTGNVIIMSAEDAPEDTIKPRLVAAGANVERVLFLESVRYGHKERPLEIPEDLPLIEDAIKGFEAKLLIVDPLMAYLVKVDANKDQEVRRVLYRISKIAERQGCAVICMRHLNKSGAGKAIYRGNSSIGVIGHARAGFIVAQDPDDSNKRVLAMSKCNLGKKPESLSFSLASEGDTCRIVWHGTSSYSADQIVATVSEEKKEKDEEKKTKQEECVELLQDMLTEPVVVASTKAELRQAGFSNSLIERAARAIGVHLYYEMVEGKRTYYWSLG